MKKFLVALALVLTVAGCAKTAVDSASFGKTMKTTETVRIYVADPEDPSYPVADLTSSEDVAEWKEKVATTIEGLSLTKSEDQKNVYGDPLFFVDLNKVVDKNYGRFVYYGDTVVVKSGEESVNYDVDSTSKEAVETLINEMVTAFIGEEE